MSPVSFFSRMKRRVVVQVVQYYNCANANDCALENGYNGKFHYMSFLPQEKFVLTNLI